MSRRNIALLGCRTAASECGRNTYRPRLERLENRLPLAGDVAATLNDGQLTILGDSADNDIRVVEVGGVVTITGLAGTTVNGAPAAVFATPGLVKVDVNMGSGNDHLRQGIIQPTGDVNVEMGDGDDIVESSNARPGGNFSIKAGQGDDFVGVGNATVGGDMNIDFEGTADLIMSRIAVDKNLSVVTKDGNDQISVEVNIAVGEDLNISTGKGDDIVTVANAVNPTPVDIGKSLTIDTDEGADRVTVLNVTTGEDLNVNTGKGDDRIRLEDVASGKSLSVSADDGDDFVSATNVAAAIDAIFNGGAGTDTLDDNGITAGSKLEIKDFEFIV